MKRIVLLCLFILVCKSVIVSNVSKEFKSPNVKFANKPVVCDTAYEYIVGVIKKYEEYVGVRYNLFSDTYIGYGHLVSKDDTLSSISEHQADSIMRCDFNENIAIIKSFVKGLPDSRLYLLAALSFNIGCKKVKYSDILEHIKIGSHDSIIEKKYYEFCWAGGKYNRKLLQRRIDEFKICKFKQK